MMKATMYVMTRYGRAKKPIAPPPKTSAGTAMNEYVV